VYTWAAEDRRADKRRVKCGAIHYQDYGKERSTSSALTPNISCAKPVRRGPVAAANLGSVPQRATREAPGARVGSHSQHCGACPSVQRFASGSTCLGPSLMNSLPVWGQKVAEFVESTAWSTRCPDDGRRKVSYLFVCGSHQPDGWGFQFSTTKHHADRRSTSHVRFTDCSHLGPSAGTLPSGSRK